MDGGLPTHFGKLLIGVGILLVIVGVLLMAGTKFSFFGLGRLPGDVAFKGKKVTFYFPIVTSLILSVAVTLIFWLVSFITKK